MLALAYPLTFTVQSCSLDVGGRVRASHAAGVLGAAVLIGSLVLIILQVANAVGRRRMVALVLGVWLGLLAGYGFVVQRDYRLAWIYQRQFWASLVRLVPDVSEGDSIIVEPQGLMDTWQIAANYWNLPVVLGQIYDFPETWHDPVWVYRLTELWQNDIVGGDGKLVLDAATVFAPTDTFRGPMPPYDPDRDTGWAAHEKIDPHGNRGFHGDIQDVSGTGKTSLSPRFPAYLIQPDDAMGAGR